MKKLTQVILTSLMFLSLGASLALADKNTEKSKLVPEVIEIIDEEQQEIIFVPIACAEHAGIVVCCLLADIDVCGQVGIYTPWGAGL